MAVTLLTVAQRRVSLARGDPLYRAEDAFECLYVIASGAFKSRIVLEDGRHQVIGFYLPGDVLGLDGIGTGLHHADVTALEESDAWVVPRDRLEEPGMLEQLPRLLAQELRRSHSTISKLGALRAAERIAAFLLDLAQRCGRPGRPVEVVALPMSRQEIGSHLGLTLETVSRVLSRFQHEGLVAVGPRRVTILDSRALAAATVRAID